MIPRSRAFAAFVLLALTTTGCNYSNPHGSQRLAPVIRIDSEPIGARLVVKRLNFVGETPCDLSEHVEVDDEIVVSLDGYQTWIGRISDLPITSLGTHKVTLVK